MRVNILPVLSGALFLSACGTHVVGEDLPKCERPSDLADFNLPQPLTGLEVRGAALVVGESCAKTSCAAEVAALDAQDKGWENNTPGVASSIEYVIGMKDGSLVGSAMTDAELVQLIGPIDTVAEATLVAELKNKWCVRAGKQDGSLQFVTSEILDDCAPIVKQEVLYRVDPDASIHEIDRGDKETSNACIGRRPAGLMRRKPLPQRSRIGDFLARSAELEAASVIAFRVLETELRSHGAPAELLSRVRDAGDDEVIHARLMQHLAERFGGRPSERSVRVAKVRELEAIALENSIEGCVSETWGCLIGMHQAEHAQGPLLQHAFRRIARDEARHAQLSWDIADWAEVLLDSAARERVSRRRADAVQELASNVPRESEPESVREVLGLPDAATRGRLFAHVRDALWSRSSS
jgi:hypothetical protein